MFEVFVQQYGSGRFSAAKPLHIVGTNDNVTRCERMVYRRQFHPMAYDAACARFPEVAAKRICAYCQQRQNLLDGAPTKAQVQRSQQLAIEQARVAAWNKEMQDAEATR